MAYSVRISGTVLSSLLYECADSEFDTEGFFLGTLSFRTTLTHDDSTEDQYEKREDFIIIHGYQIVQEKPYNQDCNILKDVVLSYQKDPSSIVGYFKFKRGVDVTLSARDQLWMESYSSNVPHGCMAIISSNLHDFVEKSTHTYEFAFWDMKDTSVKLPVEITNMNESSAGYKNFMSNASYKSVSDNKLIAQITSSDSIINQYDNLYQASLKSLKASTKKVTEKEDEILKLRQEIEEMEEIRMAK